jgi:hypothetical protein
MPFTMSHAAAVLPFSRPLARWRVLSAALIGSMVPDFHIFAPWRMERFETHSFMALFTFSLPVGLLGYWVFQYLIKVPMIEVLPDGAFARWRPFENPAPIESVRQWLVAGCGVLVGAFTHLVWDAFTHEGARGVRMLPIQDELFFDVGRHHLPFTRFMQDGSSLIGLLAVIAFVAFALRPGKQAEAGAPRLLSAEERRAWTIAIVLGSLALWAAFLGSSYLVNGVNRVGWLVYESAIASLRALAAAAILFSALLQRRLRALRTGPA